MPKVEDAMATMIANFPARTGRPIELDDELLGWLSQAHDRAG
jgi:hypothetical protein